MRGKKATSWTWKLLSQFSWVTEDVSLIRQSFIDRFAEIMDICLYENQIDWVDTVNRYLDSWGTE